MVGARAREIYDRQAKERQKVRKGNQPGTSPVNLPDLAKGDARDHAARAIGVSGKSSDDAGDGNRTESSRRIVLVTAPDYTPRRRWLGAQGGTECEFSIPGLEGERVTYY